MSEQAPPEFPTEPLTVYECQNPHCTLGSRKSPGRFTGGMTSTHLNLLDGRPEEDMVEDEDFGVGICPNCGEKATAIDEPFIHAGAGTEDTSTTEVVEL